jgi:hypothetical protein
MPDHQSPESSVGSGEWEATFSSPVEADEADVPPVELETGAELAVGELFQRIQAALDDHDSKPQWARGVRRGYFRDSVDGYTVMIEEDNPDDPSRVVASRHRAASEQYSRQLAVISVVRDRDFSTDDSRYNFTQYTITRPPEGRGLRIEQRPCTAQVGSLMHVELPMLTPAEQAAAVQEAVPALVGIHRYKLRQQKAEEERRVMQANNEDLMSEAEIDKLQHRILKLQSIVGDSPVLDRL